MRTFLHAEPRRFLTRIIILYVKYVNAKWPLSGFLCTSSALILRPTIQLLHEFSSPGQQGLFPEALPPTAAPPASLPALLPSTANPYHHETPVCPRALARPLLGWHVLPTSLVQHVLPSTAQNSHGQERCRRCPGLPSLGHPPTGPKARLRRRKRRIYVRQAPHPRLQARLCASGLSSPPRWPTSPTTNQKPYSSRRISRWRNFCAASCSVESLRRCADPSLTIGKPWRKPVQVTIPKTPAA